ncbi:MAG: hypothetical protein AAF490_27405 [Chloroflexota bacterium]
MSKTKEISKWGIFSIFTIFVLSIFLYGYLIVSFDTKNLPENHGKVQTELFVGEGEGQPLIVGLGGSEGGNAWASSYWAAQRNEFLSHGYAFLAVGYFGIEGTPKEIDRISLEGVH